MKKSFVIVFIFIIILCFFIKNINNKSRVLKIESPVEIYVDTNRNLIFDEKEPIKVNGIKTIDFSDNLKEYPLLKGITEEEKFLIKYLEQDFAQKILKNRFVEIQNGEIYIDSKRYKDILTESELFFSDTQESQKRFYKKVKSINPEEYYIYNIRSKRYHKISCESGRSSMLYKIIKKKDLDSSAIACRSCILNNIKNKKEYDFNKGNKIQRVYKNGDLKIFFLDLNGTFKPKNECTNISCQELKKRIDSAKNTIDFAIYGINNQSDIYNALIRAKSRGVKIRWVTDYDKKEDNYYKDTIKLKDIIPDVVTDREYEKNYRSAIMHNKFFIFDDSAVWTGSTNITSTGFTDFNANYSILMESKDAAKIFKDEFEKMYHGNFHTQKIATKKNTININNGTKVVILFSPQDNIINNYMIPLINSAKKYIYIPIFYITNADLIEPLQKAYKRGVDVRIINDATNSHNRYSIHKKLRDAGIKVKTENYAGKMHMKALIIDDKISLLGSMNFTKNANLQNDENVLIIYNSEVTEYLKSTFLYLWEKIPSKYLSFDPYAESLESIGSCYDGIDNDFDDKIDEWDEGCLKK